ncbi:MAG: hypothetical protein FJ403_04125 [Verrucomicrobia bacterium]|nr:hypothetical protein [Verrucomicrobiota bacterium]
MPAQSNHRIKLPDGSVLKFEGVTFGTNSFIGVKWLERSLYKWKGRPFRFKPFGIQMFRPAILFGHGDGVNVFFSLEHHGRPGIFMCGGGQITSINGHDVDMIRENGDRLPRLSVVARGYSPHKSYARVSFGLTEDKATTLRIALSPRVDGAIVRRPVVHWIPISIENLPREDSFELSRGD